MPEFIVRAHSAPTTAGAFRQALGASNHVEFLAQIVINTLFISQGHRHHDRLLLVCERSGDYSRTLILDGASLGSIGSFTESAVIDVLADALADGERLAKEETVQAASGITVAAVSFERLVRSRLEAGPVFLLDKRGQDIRATDCPPEASFVLTDHVPLPKKLAKSFVRQGAQPLSVGPVMLHASQCIVLVQNEYDRLYSNR